MKTSYALLHPTIEQEEQKENTVKTRLNEIAAAIKKGANPEKFSAELDALLGTQMEERCELGESTWEDEYRNKDLG